MMPMEQYGFVYIWRDRRTKRLYIGCHWGAEDDGYVCSSKEMRSEYSIRPRDFSRKVVQRIYSCRDAAAVLGISANSVAVYRRELGIKRTR